MPIHAMPLRSRRVSNVSSRLGGLAVRMPSTYTALSTIGILTSLVTLARAGSPAGQGPLRGFRWYGHAREPNRRRGCSVAGARLRAGRHRGDARSDDHGGPL